MSLDSVLSKFSRLAPFHRELILGKLEEDLVGISDPLVAEVLRRNLALIRMQGRFYTRSRKSSTRKRQQGGMKLSAMVGWTAATAVFTANYHGADRNLAILETLGVPYMTSQLVQTAVLTVREILPMNELMDHAMSFLTPNPVLPEPVLQAGFDTLYELVPFTQHDAFTQTKRQLDGLYADLITGINRDFSRLALAEAYQKDKEFLQKEVVGSRKSKGILHSIKGALFASAEVLAEREMQASVLTSKEFQLTAFESKGLNTTAISNILRRVLNETVPVIDVAPLVESKDLVVWSKAPAKGRSSTLPLPVQERGSPRATLARYSVPAFPKATMPINQFLDQVLGNMFTLPPVLTPQNTLELPLEFAQLHAKLQETLEINESLTAEEKRILLNLFTINYMGLCGKVIEHFESSMANTIIQEEVRRLNEMDAANVEKIQAFVADRPDAKERVATWIDTHRKTFGLITDRVREEMIHCGKVALCPMLTYKEVKAEKTIRQRLQTPYSMSAKVLFSMMAAAILVGLPAMLVAFVGALVSRTVDAHLGLLERFGVGKTRIEQMKLEFEHAKDMKKLELDAGVGSKEKRRSLSVRRRVKVT